MNPMQDAAVGFVFAVVREYVEDCTNANEYREAAQRCIDDHQGDDGSLNASIRQLCALILKDPKVGISDAR